VRAHAILQRARVIVGEVGDGKARFIADERNCSAVGTEGRARHRQPEARAPEGITECLTHVASSPAWWISSSTTIDGTRVRSRNSRGAAVTLLVGDDCAVHVGGQRARGVRESVVELNIALCEHACHLRFEVFARDDDQDASDFARAERRVNDRAASCVLPAPGVATINASAGRSPDHVSNASRCQPRSGNRHSPNCETATKVCLFATGRSYFGGIVVLVGRRRDDAAGSANPLGETF